MTKPQKNLFSQINAQALFEAATDAMLLVDNHGRVVQANLAALTLLGYSAEGIVGLEVEALMPENYRQQHHADRNKFINNSQKRPMGKGSTFTALNSSGKKIAVDIALSPLLIGNQTYILVIFHVAKQRRAAELALKVSEERLRLAKQAAGLGLFDFDAKKNEIHWDERMRELWGTDTKKSISYEKFLSSIHPDDRAVRQEALIKATNPNGSGDYSVQFRIVNGKDHLERWISLVGRMHFENGHAIRLIGIAQDITEHKKLEQYIHTQRTETEAIIKQQIAAHTASAIAHELNQPLAAISAYSEVALHALNTANAQPEKLKRALEGCVAQAQRAGTSLHELLAFLHAGDLVTEVFDINQLVKDALNIVKADGYIGFQPKLQFEENMPLVKANRLQIQKVLVNLLSNAVEAMRVAGVPMTAITVHVKTNQLLNMAHVIVQDSGPGIKHEDAKRLFEPFFTTKPTGIGMGLVISRALVESNGGQLWLEPIQTTNNDAGAEFHFTLPFAT
ncbi:MAG: PAS domain S-box protein [Methylophilaceae bacterium]